MGTRDLLKGNGYRKKPQIPQWVNKEHSGLDLKDLRLAKGGTRKSSEVSR